MTENEKSQSPLPHENVEIQESLEVTSVQKSAEEKTLSVEHKEPRIPSLSYIPLIYRVIKYSPNCRLTVSQIYNYLQARYPLFKGPTKTWLNRIRIALSSNSCFSKIPMKRGTVKRGFLWTIDPLRPPLAEDRLNRQSQDASRPLETTQPTYSDVARAGQLCPPPVDANHPPLCPVNATGIRWDYFGRQKDLYHPYPHQDRQPHVLQTQPAIGGFQSLSLPQPQRRDVQSIQQTEVSLEAMRHTFPHIYYTNLIDMAIQNSPYKMATLSDIYKFIEERFPYHRGPYKAWKIFVQSILAWNKYFKMIPQLEPHRSENYWVLDPIGSLLGVKWHDWSSRVEMKTLQNTLPATTNADNAQAKTDTHPSAVVTVQPPHDLDDPSNIRWDYLSDQEDLYHTTQQPQPQPAIEDNVKEMDQDKTDTMRNTEDEDCVIVID